MSAKDDWTKKSEKFAKDRERIKEVLSKHGRPLDMAQVFNYFKAYFRYLPNIERRMAELVKSGEVVRHEGQIKTFELA